jgi:hypothetical protein
VNVGHAVDDLLANQLDLSDVITALSVLVEQAIVGVCSGVVREIVIVPAFVELIAYHNDVFNRAKRVIERRVRALELQVTDSDVPVVNSIMEESELSNVANEAFSELGSKEAVLT